MSTTSAVELLRDGRGIYGIGVSDVFDFEALAWTCGIDPRDTWQTAHVQNLMLRPDMLRFSTKHKLSFAVLQKITGGLRDGMFSNSHEEQLRRLIHHEALIRAGLPWPPSPPSPERRIKYWSSDKKQQDRNRQIYHGLRRRSLAVINKLIGLALQEAADLDALKMARRFAFYYREPMYRAAARSRRALQLADAFPILALAVYSSAAHDWLLEPDGYSPDCYSIDHIQAKAKAATDMVERGVRLRDIAAVMQIPMALHRVKPGAAHLARARHNAEWVMSCMPGSLPRMRTWLRAVHRAHLRGGSEFADWAAKHALQIPVGSENELLSFLHDLSDWVRASRGNDGHQFVVRPFKPTMSLRTVTKLSAEWHEAVASNMTGPQLTFPAPWFPAATINDVNIIPIDNSADLYREGATMHHCVGTYAEEVRAGRFYVYSIRREGEHVATASLIRDGSSAQLHELRGPCNSPVPKQISVLVGRWLRSHTPRWGHEVATAGRSKPDDT